MNNITIIIMRFKNDFQMVIRDSFGSAQSYLQIIFISLFAFPIFSLIWVLKFNFFKIGNESFHARLKQPLRDMELQKKRSTKGLRYIYRKSVQKEDTVKICFLILDLKTFRPQVKAKHSTDREFSCLAVGGKKLDIDILVTSRNVTEKSWNLSE